MTTSLRELAGHSAGGLALLQLHEYLIAHPERQPVTAFDALSALAQMPCSDSERSEILHTLVDGGQSGASIAHVLVVAANVARLQDVHRSVVHKPQGGAR